MCPVVSFLTLTLTLDYFHPGWIEDVFHRGYSRLEVTKLTGKLLLRPGQHLYAHPFRGSTPPEAIERHLQAGCEANGLNIRVADKGTLVRGAFCCAAFPSPVNRHPCRAVPAHNDMWMRSNAMFFGFLRFAAIFAKHDVPVLISQGGVIGLAREGDLNCHDHDIDLMYNPTKHYTTGEAINLQSGIMKQIMEEVRNIPLALEADPKEGEPGASWDSAEYDVGSESCLDKTIKARDEGWALGLSRVRIHMEACTGSMGGSSDKYHQPQPHRTVTHC